MLDPEQHHQLGGIAERRGQSIGSLVRESVARYLADLSLEEDPLLGLIGLADDAGARPHGDVAFEHDLYITDEVADGSNGEATPAQDSPTPAKAQSRRRSHRATRPVS